MDDFVAHSDALLVDGRCGLCAERVPLPLLLRQGECPFCGASLQVRGRTDLLRHLDLGRRKWRIIGYGLVALLSFGAGWLPLVQALVQVAALVVLHVLLIRQSLLWLGLARRLTTRFALRFFGALLATVGLLVNIVVAPWVGAGSLVLAVLGFVLTAVYVEGSLLLVRRRLEWEADGLPIRFSEWSLPMLLLLTLSGTALAGVASIVGVLRWVGLAQAASLLGVWV